MGKIHQVVWTEIAFQEYEEIIDWLLLNWSIKTAVLFSELVEQKVISIKNNPFLGSKSRYIEGCRKLWVPPYHLLIYRVKSETIEIVRFFDGRRNPKKLLKDY
jgi:plasmid stabilization system protein ParE